MLDLITYQYPTPSTLLKAGALDELLLSKFSETDKKESPCFFWGRIADPFSTARCLVSLSNVVQSSFNLSPAEIAKMKDPIITAGNNTIRFEGFSQCAGVYARVDILPGGHDGEFLESGTTNVDFNQSMISALNQVARNEQLVMGIGQKEFSIAHSGEKQVERKVPLPVKWIKGLTSVQVFLSESTNAHTLNRNQAIQLFRSIPKGRTREDYYLQVRGDKSIFTPAKTANAICIGAVYRLRLIEGLIPYADKLVVYAHDDMQSNTWELHFGQVRFSLTISRDAWRGFSGEGAALESLIEDVPEAWIAALDKIAFANQAFNPTLLAIEKDVSVSSLDKIASQLSAMGLLGFDLESNQFFYRKLPFKLSRILSLNPRLKDAEKLVEEGKVEIMLHSGDRVEAKVLGSGVMHIVILDHGKERCTCTWFSRHQGERGNCKHVLAVKKKLAL